MKNIKILQSNKVCKNFYVVLFLLNSESKITYWNIKIRADEHATNGEKGVSSQNQYFSPFHLHLMSIKTYRWPFS